MSSKLENIGNSCIDIRLAIKEQDNTLAAGSITTLGDDIRTIENRNYAYVLCRTQTGEMKTVKVHCKTNNTSPQFSSLIDDEIVACILPENITALGRSAFQSTSVEYINLENVVDFGAISLNKCQNLKLDTSSIVNAKWIAGSAFSMSAISGELYLPNLIGFCYSNQNPSTSGESSQFQDTNITKIMDLGSAPRINTDTFSNCKNLTEVHFPETCNLYGNSIFYLDTKLTKIYFKNLESLLKNVTYRYDTSHPFRYLADGTPTEVYVNDVLLTSVVIPNDTTIINPYTFYNFTGLTSVTIPESVTVISDSAFRGCTGITSINIPESVTTIGPYAFYNCSSALTGALLIPSTVTSIGTYAFFHFTNLTSIVTPSSCTSIGKSAFQGCNSIVDATFNANTNSDVWYNGGEQDVFGNNTGTLTINGSFTLSAYCAGARFLHFNISGDFTKTNSSGFGGLLRGDDICTKTIRIGGNVNSVGGSIIYYRVHYNHLEFLEVKGTITGEWLNNQTYTSDGNCIIHLGYNGIAGTASNCAASANWNTKIYVGDGSSAAHDDAILQQYLADTNWAQYSSKLDTWYNYINSPDANPDYIN